LHFESYTYCLSKLFVPFLNLRRRCGCRKHWKGR